MQIPGHIDPQTVPRKPAPARPDGKRVLLGLSKEAMRTALIDAGIPEKQAKMRVSQVWNWIYHRGVTDIDRFANVSKDTRALLAEHFVVGRPEVVTAQVSTDGTRKWLLRFDDGEEAECVFIPDAYRGTLCVSSQVGCTLNCRFWFTGT
ncbi:MAG: 23S rRNA (adenine(2503)-C(2))-methyltransferase RlmN, partial [Sandarakinorhabdus sp.]|nr:23S rRNA (adenine(2503)-C(2))-methyltransferase RlmN [Sandarakinorhabdus sp.]